MEKAVGRSGAGHKNVTMYALVNYLWWRLYFQALYSTGEMSFSVL